MFYGNEVLKTNIEQGRLELDRTINNIRTFLTAVPEVSLPIDAAFRLNCLYTSSQP